MGARFVWLWKPAHDTPCHYGVERREDRALGARRLYETDPNVPRYYSGGTLQLAKLQRLGCIRHKLGHLGRSFGPNTTRSRMWVSPDTAADTKREVDNGVRVDAFGNLTPV